MTLWRCPSWCPFNDIPSRATGYRDQPNALDSAESHRRIVQSEPPDAILDPSVGLCPLKTLRVPDAQSQRHINESLDADATFSPSGEKETHQTSLECLPRVTWVDFWDRFKRETRPLELPNAIVAPLGEKQTECIDSQYSWPFETSDPVLASQRHIFPSRVPNAICVPSGEKQTDGIETRYSVNDRMDSVVPVQFHKCNEPSEEPHIIFVPSGEKATASITASDICGL
ncbi:hypothetical protein FRC02_000671 [Tulasnella sp. 418]|nr:hypothetical protein FRC02_000671 [Tulasnella sp. 418]